MLLTDERPVVVIAAWDATILVSCLTHREPHPAHLAHFNALTHPIEDR